MFAVPLGATVDLRIIEFARKHKKPCAHISRVWLRTPAFYRVNGFLQLFFGGRSRKVSVLTNNTPKKITV